MLKNTSCRSELHMTGGEGAVWQADVLSAAPRLLEEYGGSVRMVYADPPSGAGGCALRRGQRLLEPCEPMSSEEYRVLIASAAQLAHGLLADDGTFFLHTDSRYNALCRTVCEGVFGRDAFVNEIIWAYRSGGRSQRSFARKHDVILMFRKSPSAYFNIAAAGMPRGPERRNHMKRAMDEQGRMYFSIRTGGREYRYYDDDPVYPSDVWDDIEQLNQRDHERTGFITQKPMALFKRMLLCCTTEGDLIADLFAGSGSCSLAAAGMGRRFLAVDSSAASLAVMRSRLLMGGAARPLYLGSMPFTVRYECAPEKAPCTAPEQYFDCSRQGAKLILRLKKLPIERAPYYAAVGSLREGVFMPTDYILGCRPGEELTLTPGNALQLVDDCLREGLFI